MSIPILTVSVRQELDVVTARRRARHLAALLGFDPQDQTRISTAVSEIARNAFAYGQGGRVEFAVEGDAPQRMRVTISDKGPGIPNLKRILAGGYQSQTGMGLGIIGAQRLMDDCTIETAEGAGTVVTLMKRLPLHAPKVTPERSLQISDELARIRLELPLEELQHQNQVLLQTLDELHQRQEEMARLNQELEDTNRGVVALYAELDEKAEHLRRADELKSRFLSNMSHEFRTPLNSILALSRLLLDRTDGDLSGEQEKQINFIRQGAESLSELVNDLLDLAKVEAGKTEVHVAPFLAGDLFGALRGMLRPLLQNDSVNLVFDAPEAPLMVESDEGKIAQILRNLISNALKFTDQGEVRVSATLLPGESQVMFSVADSGVGIPQEHQETIFQEFTQLAGRLQNRVKGTGLGLPLSRRLAELLGGGIELESSPGVGSTFRLIIPRVYAEHQKTAGKKIYLKQHDQVIASHPAAKGVLVIDDEDAARYLVKHNLQNTQYVVSEARNGHEGIKRARTEQPDLIVLDLVMPGITGFEVLEALKSDPATEPIPVIIFTSKVLEPEERALLTSRGASILPKDKISRDIVALIGRIIAEQGSGRTVRPEGT